MAYLVGYAQTCKLPDPKSTTNLMRGGNIEETRLDLEDGWEFGPQEIIEYPEFESLSCDIAETTWDPWINDPFTKNKVEAECKGLPLDPRVIASPLRGEPRPVWENAKKTLSRAQSISEYHKDELLRCLETSIDVLDDESKECFLDLDALLERQDAFVVLLELSSRNLLNLTSYPGSRAISLRGEPRPVWENAKKTLSRGQSISEYHKDELLRCLETSIDVLDDESKECFLDLDALLDPWVYTHGMERQDAFVVLLELSSRNLLNLTSYPGSRAISLRGEPRPVWENAKKTISRAQSISEYPKDELLRCLETSIDVLDDESKECFLDLDSLLDSWVYTHGMERQDAFVVLLELSSRNLLNLTSYPGSRAISFGCASELSFSQHDVMRDLAFRLANQDSTIHCKRLFMSSEEDNIPTKWLTLKDQASKAQFVSIHTGPMEEQNWCQINFPEVEVLTLFFAGSRYCLPKFLHTMLKLKVAIIYNYSSKRSTLHGLPSFPAFPQIKSVLLERLIVSPLYEYCRSSESLEKLPVCLCEGLGNMTLLDKGHDFPKLPILTTAVIWRNCLETYAI